MSQVASTVRIKVAADMLGVTPQTVRNWVATGHLAARRHPINGYRLFDLAEISRVAQLQTIAQSPAPPRYKCRRKGNRGIRECLTSDGELKQSTVASEQPDGDYCLAHFELDWLRQTKKPPSALKSRVIRIADAFCGGGIFSLGADEGLRSVGFRASHSFGIDFNKEAIDTFKKNFPESNAIHGDVLAIAHGPFGSRPSLAEREFVLRTGDVEVLIGGPPCQGNSDLNNHTRRIDPKNELYFSMVRLAELLRPKLLLIENVPGVLHDKGNVVMRTAAALQSLGYGVAQAVVDLQRIGVPQRRKRLIVMAWSSSDHIDLEEIILSNEVDVRPVSWAISDLENRYNQDSIFDSSAVHSIENKRRIEYLFKHNLYELPNEQRPPCHRDKAHSYVSVYGRMHWEQPAPTITGGFGSTGQGRFVHPRFPRTLTPHEACRIQFVPDFFKFSPNVGRRAMQQIIGNAAPPKLSQILIAEAAARGVI